MSNYYFVAMDMAILFRISLKKVSCLGIFISILQNVKDIVNFVSNFSNFLVIVGVSFIIVALASVALAKVSNDSSMDTM